MTIVFDNDDDDDDGGNLFFAFLFKCYRERKEDRALVKKRYFFY